MLNSDELKLLVNETKIQFMDGPEKYICKSLNKIGIDAEVDDIYFMTEKKKAKSIIVRLGYESLTFKIGNKDDKNYLTLIEVHTVPTWSTHRSIYTNVNVIPTFISYDHVISTIEKITKYVKKHGLKNYSDNFIQIILESKM